MIMFDGDDDHSDCSCAERDGTLDGLTLVLAPERVGRGVMVYRLLHRTSFSWGNISRNETLQYQIRRYVLVDTADDAQLVVRVHEGAGAGAIEVAAEVVSFSPDEPEVVFVAERAAATILIPADGVSGYCVNERLRGDLGSHIRLVITFTRDGLASANTAALSADLVVRTALDSAAGEEAMPCVSA
jgi:hypothetical protein